MSGSYLQARAPQSPLFRPELMLGLAAFPLWGFFAGAAILGSAWWWASRWMQPLELEAMATGPLGQALVGDELPMLPVGGEAAPFGAAVLEAELVSEPEIAADLAAVAEPAAAPRKGRAAPPQSKPH